MQKSTAVPINNFSFEYEAITRGSYNKVVVSGDSVTTIKDRDMKDVTTTRLNTADRDFLLSALNKINLNTIQDLKSPTNKRQYDGALIANLVITKDGKTYQSAGFDHGEPPAEIKPVVDKIVALSDLKYKK